MRSVTIIREIFGVCSRSWRLIRRRRAVRQIRRQHLPIHAIGEQRLRMERVSHVDAVPLYAHFAGGLPGVREWHEHDVACFGAWLHHLQHRGERTPVHSAM